MLVGVLLNIIARWDTLNTIARYGTLNIIARWGTLNTIARWGTLNAIARWDILKLYCSVFGYFRYEYLCKNNMKHVRRAIMYIVLKEPVKSFLGMLYIVVPCTLKHSVYPVTITFHKYIWELQIGVFAVPPSNESSAV